MRRRLGGRPRRRLTVLFLLLVRLGAIPIARRRRTSSCAVPFHAFRNHYDRAAPYLPSVAVIVPAWNEGAVIAASIERLMSLEYPPERLRVYVVDDASTDDTPDVVRAKARLLPGAGRSTCAASRAARARRTRSTTGSASCSPTTGCRRC